MSESTSENQTIERPKVPWWQEVADQHAKQQKANSGPWKCSCGGCQKARLEGYHPPA